MRAPLLALVALALWTSAHAGVLDERIGPVRIGMSDRQLRPAAGAPTHEGAPSFAGAATSDWQKAWRYGHATVTLAGARETARTWRVRSITVERGSTWRTRRGIGIGSTRAQVERAYRGLVKKAAPSEHELVIGGMNLTFARSRVVKMYLGASF
jgi:hypothetical protein